MFKDVIFYTLQNVLCNNLVKADSFEQVSKFSLRMAHDTPKYVDFAKDICAKI